MIGFRAHACWCRKCKQVHYAPIDEATRRAGLVGPRLTALIAYLKGACHCSYSTIRKFIHAAFKIELSDGLLAKLSCKVRASLEKAYEELAFLLPNESRLNVVETGHKNNGDPMWTWCFRASLFTLLKIDESRGSEVLIKILGTEFDGILGCDYFSAFRKGPIPEKGPPFQAGNKVILAELVGVRTTRMPVEGPRCHTVLPSFHGT